MPRITNATAQTMLAAITARLNSGYIRCYSGTAPTDLDVALSGPVLLGTLRFGATAFGATADHNPGARADANAITPDLDADADGEISFLRLYEDDNTTLVLQLSAGESESSEVVFEDASIVESGNIEIASLRLTYSE